MGSGICEHKRQKYDCSICLGFPRSMTKKRKKRLSGESFEDAVKRWEKENRWEPDISQDRERILDAFDFEISQCLKTFYSNRSIMSFIARTYTFRRDYSQEFDIVDLSIRAKETFASPSQRIRSLASQIFAGFPPYMRHVFWQFLIGPVETTLLGLDRAKQPKLNHDGSMQKDQIRANFANKCYADVGVIFKEGKELQMVIPNYDAELKYNSSALQSPRSSWINASWYNSFLLDNNDKNNNTNGQGSSTAGKVHADTLPEIIKMIEAKNENSVQYVCESLMLELPISNYEPHSMVIQVQQKICLKRGEAFKNVGILIVPSDANINYLMHWSGKIYIDNFVDIWDDTSSECSAALCLKNNDCRQRTYSHLKEGVSSDGFAEIVFYGKKIGSLKCVIDGEDYRDLVDIKGSFQELCRSIDPEQSSTDLVTPTKVECSSDNMATCDVIPSLEETIFLPMKDITESRRMDKYHTRKYQAQLQFNIRSKEYVFDLSAISRAERLPNSKYPIAKKNMSKALVNNQIWYSRYHLQS